MIELTIWLLPHTLPGSGVEPIRTALWVTMLGLQEWFEWNSPCKQ